MAQEKENLEKQTEWIRLLYRITSQESSDLQQQLKEALKLTINLLNLDVGIISRIEGGDYIIDTCYPPESGLEQGQRFDLGNTYCSITLDEGAVTPIEHMKRSPHKRHPCYETFKLESYIGVPLEIDQKLYGTLNFSSAEPRENGFSEMDTKFIRLLGEWVEGVVKRRQVEAKNKEQHENLEAIIENTDSLIWSVDSEYRLLTFNSSYAKAVENTAGKLPQKGKSALSHEPTEEEKKKWKSKYDAVLSSGKSTSFIDKNRFKQSVTVFDVSLYPIKDEQSKIVGVSGFAKDITQTRQLEKQINKFFELSLDLMAIAKTDGYFKQVNPAFADTLGFTQEEMTTQPAIRFVHPDDVEQSKQVTAKLAQGEQTINYTNRCLCKDGSFKWISWKAEADVANGLIYTTGRDVTQEKEIREQLKLREERYGLAIAGASAGIWDWFDVNENEQWWSPVFYELLGYEDQEIEASLESFKELLHPDDQEQTFTLVEDHFANQKPFDIEYRLKTKSGEYRWFSGSAQADFDKEGNPTRLVGTITDIEERKKLESILHDTQEIVQVGGWELNIETGDILWTDEVYRIYELPIGTEVKVEDGISYYAPEAQPVIEEAVNKAIETGGGWDLELPFITAKGNRKWVRSTGKVEYREGSPFKLLGTFQDLTARKKMEDELVIAKEQADTANKAKSQFIANMSHEIRTPMNAILGFTELLKGKVEDEVSKNYVENIHSSGKNLLSLINDILDLSKIESGKEEIQLQAVSVSRLVNEMRDIFSLKAEQKGIEVKTSIEDDLPQSLLLDEVRLRQVLLNLVGNAIKFTHEGYVKIGVRTAHTNKHESMVNLIFDIEDTGIGIDKDKQETVFQEFEQQDFSISQQYGGTGLGLAISKKLIGMMNGKITVESEKEKGSTFNLFIPDVTIASVVEKSGIERIDWDESKLKPAKVLIVDDLAINRELVSEYLKEQPLELLEAGTGRDAIEIVQKESPDLVLMDIKMPGMSGVEAMQEIKENSDIFIIALTASGFKGFGDQAQKMGFDAYLRKPVTRKQLVQELAKFIGVENEALAQPNKENEEANKDEFINEIEEIGLSKLNEILDTIDEELIPEYEKVDQNAMVMSQYEAFAELLEKAAAKHELVMLKKISRELVSAAQLFDIEQIELQLNAFKTHIENLRKEILNELERRNL